jgi:uncharacterized membrane protein YkvA (DUF1232 family)
MASGRTTYSDDDERAARRGKDAQESLVRRGFWGKLRRFAASLPFAEDLLAAYYCAFDRETPGHVRVALLGALAYFVLPLDALPDMLPLLGFTDDAAVLATTIKLVSDAMLPEHREAARRALEKI